MSTYETSIRKKAISRIRLIASKGIKDGSIEKSQKHYAWCGFPWKICKYSTVDYVESREQTVGHGNPIRAKRSESFLFARPRHGHAMQISAVCTLCNNFMEIADPARNFETHLARVIRAQTYRKEMKVKKKVIVNNQTDPFYILKGFFIFIWQFLRILLLAWLSWLECWTSSTMVSLRGLCYVLDTCEELITTLRYRGIKYFWIILPCIT